MFDTICVLTCFFYKLLKESVYLGQSQPSFLSSGIGEDLPGSLENAERVGTI